MSVSVYDLWSEAVPLKRAWIEFAESWSKEGETVRATYLAFERPVRAKREGWPIPDGYRAHFDNEEFEFIERKRRQWEKNLKADLLTQLTRGDCVAYGKPWMPHRSEDVVTIPGHVFDPDTDIQPEVDFAGGQVTARGCSFVEIRVLSKAKLEQFSIPPTLKRRGPKSFKNEIETVVKELMAADKDWLKRPFREREKQIISKAKERFSYISGNQPKGFSRTVIDEVVKEILTRKSDR